MLQAVPQQQLPTYVLAAVAVEDDLWYVFVHLHAQGFRGQGQVAAFSTPHICHA